MSTLLTLHLLAAVVWVGGMFFAYMALRPAAGPLDPAVRLALWQRVFDRFLHWVWAAVALLLVTGYWMALGPLGGFKGLGIHIHIMQGLGWIMILLFLHLYFAPYRCLRAALAADDIPKAARCLSQIRFIVAANLALGLLVVAVAAGGRHMV
jgi:uncharacterized membrane protein